MDLHRLRLIDELPRGHDVHRHAGRTDGMTFAFSPPDRLISRRPPRSVMPSATAAAPPPGAARWGDG